MEKYIRITAFACMVACAAEFAVMFILGEFYPFYNQFEDTVSVLGSSRSPVSAVISTWWSIEGLIFMAFGYAFYKAFPGRGKYAVISACLIIIYGFGEGIGSGAFKADHAPDRLTTSLIIHDALGGLGLVAIGLLPLIMQKVFKRDEMPDFHRFSKIVFIIGLVTGFLFFFRYIDIEQNVIKLYKGLWQRLFALNACIYLVSIALLMLKRQRIS